MLVLVVPRPLVLISASSRAQDSPARGFLLLRAAAMITTCSAEELLHLRTQSHVKSCPTFGQQLGIGTRF